MRQQPFVQRTLEFPNFFKSVLGGLLFSDVSLCWITNSVFKWFQTMNKVAQSSDKPVVLLSSQPEKKTIKCMICVPKVFISSRTAIAGAIIGLLLFFFTIQLEEEYWRSPFFNCSQTKFVAIILVLLVFFNAIFRLTDFSSDAFDFSSSKTG